MSELKGTRVYGMSDNQIVFDGDLTGEIEVYPPDNGNDDLGKRIAFSDITILWVIVAFSDGTTLAIRHGKPGLAGLWSITPLQKGDMFDYIHICNDVDAKPNSDMVHFTPGRLKAWPINAGCRKAWPIDDGFREESDD